MSLGTIADAAQAITRLNDIFEAELLDDNRVVDHNLDVALRIEDASFSWEAPAPQNDGNPSQKAKSNKGKTSIQTKDETSQQAEKIFSMSDINFEIPRGQLIAIVGTVGSGKTSLLQGLIGEMRRTSGKVSFGGSVAYCSQNAFIQVSLLV
jgi:ABC-type transport system involved in cytochrome bd biosynthesis fused ATPase/permease subunit